MKNANALTKRWTDPLLLRQRPRGANGERLPTVQNELRGVPALAPPPNVICQRRVRGVFRPERRAALSTIQAGARPSAPRGSFGVADSLALGWRSGRPMQCPGLRSGWRYLVGLLAIGVGAISGWTFESPATKPARPELIVAVERGDHAAVERLLKDRVDLEVRTPDGVTPLYAAAFRGNAKMIRVLVQAGARVDGHAAHRRTPLFTAAAEGHLPAVEALLELGADVNARSEPQEIGQTALHMAALEGKTAVARRLVEHRAQVNAATEQHHLTPLHLARLAGHEETAATLIAAGADPMIEDVFGQTPQRAAATMEEGKSRKLVSVFENHQSFDPGAIVVLPVLAESHYRQVYRGNRLGVALGDGSLVATAWHCLTDILQAEGQAMLAKPLVFSAFHGDVFEAEIVAMDEAADVAILRVDWEGHPALPLATDEALGEAKAISIVGYPPPEKVDGSARSTTTVSLELLPVLRTKSPSQVVLGGGRFTGPGWSGAAMIIPESGMLAGIFTRKDDPKVDDLIIYRNRSGPSFRAIRELLKSKDLPLGNPAVKLERRPDSQEAFSAAIRWLDSRTGRPPREEVLAAEALVKLRPSSAQARRLLASSVSSMLRQSPGDKAVRERADSNFKEAVRLAPESAVVRAAYGLHLDVHRESEAALIQFEEAARIDPKNAFVQATRLKILSELKPEEAATVGRQLVADRPGVAAFWFHHAGALRKLGRNEEALAAARTAVGLAPAEQLEYKGRLAETLAKCGQLDDAEACFRELIAKRPESPSFWLSYGRFLVASRPDRVADQEMALKRCEALNKSGVIPQKVMDEFRASVSRERGLSTAESGAEKAAE